MYCIETKHLTHHFREDELALDNVNLQVQDGAIYGFLGPNGAGKTTTLKLILGLLKKQRGDITVFGKSFDHNRIGILRRIGSMIESPSIYAHLTAAENMRLLQTVYGTSPARSAEVLELVGLAKTGSKKAAQFSLGMKQRLSIAIALLHSPQLLILDEPTNGLDPNGILEIRELLKTLNRQYGITILISSHLLPEIEKLVTHTGIINGGRLLFQGTLPELMKKRQQNSVTIFETSDLIKTHSIAVECGFAAQIDERRVAMPLLQSAQIAGINQRLVRGGIDVYQIAREESDLEKIFFEVISE